MTLSNIFLYIFIAVIALIIYFIRKRLNYWQDRGIACNTPHLLYGDFREFSKTLTLHEIYENMYTKFKDTGPFCGMYIFQKPIAFILDLQLIKRILIKDFANFADRDWYHNEQDDPLSSHLFLMSGKKWKNLRQKLTPVFTTGRMKLMFPSIVSVANELTETIERQLLQQHEVLELHDLCSRFITDVIGTCGFGLDCHSLKEPKAGFYKVGRDMNRDDGNVLYVFMESFPELARRLKMRQIPDDIHKFFMRAVRETVCFREQHNVRRNDFLDVLIELKHDRDKPTDKSATELTIEQIAAQMFIFFTAGFETSATTISFALYELAQHQNMQHKVRQEINEAFARHNNEFNYECMKELHYLEQIIKETLRLYSPTPEITRQAKSDYIVPGYPQYKIEKGVSVLIPIRSVHCDAQYYPEPYAFKPERFSKESMAERDSLLWLPFGNGPRHCIGMRFGEMQIRIGLALLLKNFKFDVCDATRIPIEYDPKCLILTAKDGIQLRVEKIPIKYEMKTLKANEVSTEDLTFLLPSHYP